MNRPRFDAEEDAEFSASWLDVIALELAIVRWPHVLAAAIAGFALGIVTCWRLT